MGYSGTFHANVGAGFKPAIPRFREPEGGLQTRPYAGWIRTRSAGLGTEADLPQSRFGSGGRIGVLWHLPYKRRGRFQTCPYAGWIRTRFAGLGS